MGFQKCAMFLSMVFLILAVRPGVAAQNDVRNVIGTPNNQHRVVNTYPEYWVDGKPFFVHAANFNYYRIPRDRWAEELVRMQSMGINTLDLIPMWNWHQPKEDVLDFSGKTNPRRDLDYLLRVSQLMGFKILFRPGPYTTNDWRNGGYPDWLLRRPEYHTSEQTILEGRFPPLSAQQYENQEESSAGWLKNETHLRYTREWYGNVLGRMTPFLAEKGGPIIGIQPDDDMALGLENYAGPKFWKYMDLLRRYGKEATHGSSMPYFLDAAAMRINAEAGDATSEPFWNTGQDYEQVGENYEISGKEGYSTTVEAASNKFLLEILKTQPLVVPATIEFQAGWRVQETDNYASFTHPSNTLLATRVMFQNGLKGLGYFPLHDTLNPAGDETEWVNHQYGFEAAVNYAGVETPRALYVRRNGRLLQGMGALLASSHLLADAGLVYPMATYPKDELGSEEAAHVGNEAARTLWSGAYGHYNFELIDSDHTPEENFQRYRVLLLPNLASSKDDLKLYPHLEKYSGKAQKMIEQYVAAGGTLVVFPSLPKGEIFDRLFSTLGSSEEAKGDGEVQFNDGNKARILERRYLLRPPVRATGEVKVFARDEKGSVLGARVGYGKGRVLYFGGDFSLWSIPRGSGFAYRTGPHMDWAHDYPEDVQRSARAALSLLMKEAGVRRRVDYESVPKKARDPELYLSELAEDWGSRPFERRSGEGPGYGFVGVTNFSTDEQYSKEIQVSDPRAQDFTGESSPIRLPLLTIPARESMMLPIRIPLVNPYWTMAPGLEASDEVYYATSELSNVRYDGSQLELEFTAPADGEVALRLTGRPRGAKVDGEAQTITEDAQRHLWVVKIPKGNEPHYIRRLVLEYPRGGMHVSIDGAGAWISATEHVAHVRVENPGGHAFDGTLNFAAGAISPRESRVVSVPAGGAMEYSFVVKVPEDALENQVVELQATLRENSTASWGWRSEVTLHHPFTFSVTPLATFPMREDLSIPIVHPLLASVNLPGEAHFQVKVKNWGAEKQKVTLTCQGGEGLRIDGASPLEVAGNSESNAELRVVPGQGSGVYRFTIDMRTDSYQASEGVVLAAVQAGEAVAYTLDYDRDGFEDVILENQKLRLYLSPLAGGQSYGFVLKDTNANAFDSVGDLRDNFSMRVVPEELRGKSQQIENHSLESRGLFNRPYAFHIRSNKGTETRVELEYFAPDIYPQGVKVERTVSLRGGESFVRVNTTMTPQGLAQSQSYILENSVPFRSMDGPNYNQWFCFPETRSAQEFEPMKDVPLSLKQGVVGTVNKKTGETFALMVLTPADKGQLSVQNHSALIRISYPSFTEANHSFTYRVAYYFGKGSQEEVQDLFTTLKSGDSTAE